MNTAASIRARLLNASKKSGEAFQSLLVRYAVERFLYRLGKSSHQNSFVLKGAMLFVAWGGRPHRPTKDLDLLGFGDPGQADVARRIAEIAAGTYEDGIEFDLGSIKTELIKEDAEYEGVRVQLTARLEHARVPLQIDIGFGDAVTPEPVTIQFPTILERVEAPFYVGRKWRQSRQQGRATQNSWCGQGTRDRRNLSYDCSGYRARPSHAVSPR